MKANDSRNFKILWQSTILKDFLKTEQGNETVKLIVSRGRSYL